MLSQQFELPSRQLQIIRTQSLEGVAFSVDNHRKATVMPSHQSRPAGAPGEICRKRGSMQSLREIKIEFLGKRMQKRAEAIADWREADDELNASLREAGINDGLPERFSFDALAKGEDEVDYRQRVREMVFSVSNIELRKNIIRQIQHRVRFLPDEAHEMLTQFDDQFIAALRDKRCQPPRIINSPMMISTIPLAVICLAFSNWFGGTADVLIVGFGVVLPGTLFVVLRHIAELHRYDVVMQEAIKDIEGGGKRTGSLIPSFSPAWKRKLGKPMRLIRTATRAGQLQSFAAEHAIWPSRRSRAISATQSLGLRSGLRLRPVLRQSPESVDRSTAAPSVTASPSSDRACC